jgi:hypothetical protein
MRRLSVSLSILCTLLVVCLMADTNLPGPINALPNGAHTTANGICSKNAAQTKQSCFTAGNSNSFNWNLQVKDSGYTFDNTQITHSLLPATTRTYSLGDCASSATCPSGSGDFEYASAHIQTIYNYGPNPGGMYSDTQPTSIANHASQPIYFYTANALRAQIDGSGGWSVAGLGGSGTHCAQVNNSGTFSNYSGGCGGTPDPNIYLTTQCFVINPLTTSYQAECPLLTISQGGYYLITASIQFVLYTNVASALFALNFNGTILTPSTYGYGAATQDFSVSSGTITTITAYTITQSWVFNVGVGETLGISAVANTGTIATNSGILTAVYLHS